MSTGIFHWDAGLAVVGRTRDIGHSVLRFSFQTGRNSSSSYFHVLFLIAFLEQTFIINIIIILCINYIIVICINTHNAVINNNYSRSQWPRDLRRRSAAARLLRLWVRIRPGAWMFVCCECCMLSGRGLCDGLTTRPEDSYRLWCVAVCDLEKNLKNMEAIAQDWAASAIKKIIIMEDSKALICSSKFQWPR